MKLRFALSLASSVAVSTLAGCGSAASNDAVVGPDGLQADGNYAAPEGCSQTECDVEFAECQANATRQCDECTDECSSPYAPDDCFSTCADICGNPATAQGCQSASSDCRKTMANTVCSDSPSTAAAQTSGNDDAGAGDPAAPITTCQAVDPGDFSSPYPAVASPDACTQAQLHDVAEACADDLDAAACTSALAALDATCNACVISSETSETPGAVLIDPTGARYFNQGGCVALTDPPCGSQASAMVACIEHACGSCDDPSCADEAESSYCARFAFDTQCSANETNDIVCYPSATLTTEQFIEQLLQTFCSH